MVTNLEYLTDSEGILTAVVIPIELWRQLLPDEDFSLETISEAIADYCLNKAMDEGKKTKLFDRNKVLKFLED